MQFVRQLMLTLMAGVFVSAPSMIVAGIQYVTVEAKGAGPTQQAAIDEALINAIGTINGVEIAASTQLQIVEEADDKRSDINETYQQAVRKDTKGLIKDYEVLGAQQLPSSEGLWSVKVRATIAKYAVSQQANRLRMAVIPFELSRDIPDWKNPAGYQNKFTHEFVSYMTQTRKFAILDRENIEAQEKELSLLQKGQTPLEELAKLGQRITADYIVTGRIDDIYYNKTSKQLQVSGKTISSVKQGARVTFRIIDVATGQIKFADSIDEISHTSTKGVSVSAVARSLASKAGDIILNAIYPLRVESVHGEKIYIGQGGSTLHIGDEFQLVRLGSVLKDSYTGESLGREEEIVGAVKITQVQSKQSQGVIIDSTLNVAKSFKPGDFIVRPKSKAESKNAVFKNKEKSVKKSVDSFENSLSSDW